MNFGAEPRGLREAAIEWLVHRSEDGQVPLTREDIKDFHFNGEDKRLIPPVQGIWLPKNWQVTLSVVTTFTPPGRRAPYNDEVGSDGLIRYAWRGDDGDHRENVGLRNAMELGVPIIWFVGVQMQPARFNVVTPVYVVAEEPEQRRFVLMPTTYDDPPPPRQFGSAVERGLSDYEKRYVERTVKQRVHQPRFRSEVLLAYDNHCAVCNLAHAQLLDAAHIVPDSQAHGVASVTNGMALCKIHHAAFDAYFLGVRPDGVVEIRNDLLDEIDGPMLRHGLQELHGKPLMALPKQRASRPNRDALAWQYERFHSASITDVRSQKLF